MIDIILIILFFLFFVVIPISNKMSQNIVNKEKQIHENIDDDTDDE